MEIFSIDVIFLVIIVAPILVCCILTILCYCFCRNPFESRYQSPTLYGALRYLKENIIIPEEFAYNARRLTKREKRRIKYRQFLSYRKDKEQKEEEEEEQRELERQYEDPDTLLERLIKSSKILTNIRNSFLGNPNSSQKNQGFFSWFSTKEDNSSKGPEVSTKSKRFISQDRLQRAEARKLLIKQKSMKIFIEEEAPEEKTENVHSLLDIESQQVVRQVEIQEKRKSKHESLHEERKQADPEYIPSTVMNAGPLPHQMPVGYRMVHFIPNIEPETLLYKRCLYKIEGKHEKVQGWFLGTIGSICKLKGCNYNVKYDRAETGSLFVDGFRPVMLSLSGDNAYGRRWILVEKVVAQAPS